MASISISVMSRDNGLVEMTKQAANKTKNSVSNDQSDISSLSGMLGDFLDEEGKPQSPETETPPVVQTYTLAEVDSSKIDSMKKWPSVVDGNVNSILTSYDSDLTPIDNSVVRKKYTTFYYRLEGL